jgi:hypothetical protein
MILLQKLNRLHHLTATFLVVKLHLAHDLFLEDDLAERHFEKPRARFILQVGVGVLQ